MEVGCLLAPSLSTDAALPRLVPLPMPVTEGLARKPASRAQSAPKMHTEQEQEHPEKVSKMGAKNERKLGGQNWVPKQRGAKK